jgi:hypothetical protein
MNQSDEDKALTLLMADRDVDMLADVKQMAVAGEAEQVRASFENQLWPIDIHVMWFLKCSDLIIDKTAVNNQGMFHRLTLKILNMLWIQRFMKTS